MPWSEWQPGEVLRISPDRVQLLWLPDTTTTTYQTDTGMQVMVGSHSAPSRWPTDSEVGTSSRYTEGSSQTQPTLNGYNYWAPDGWDARRDWRPSTLDNLTRGVDYDVIPGKDEYLDDDAFVEFEAGSNGLDGWDLGTFTVEGHTVTQDVTKGVTTATAAAFLGSGSQARDPFLPLSNPEPGVQWEQWDLDNSTDGLQFQPPDPGAVFSWYFFVDVGATGPPETLGAVNFLLAPIELRLQQPRWRYWIPGDIPLRQRQRDDGLGMSTARWRRGRSVQASNRWKGYL